MRAAIGFSKLLYWVEDQFEKLPIHDMWWPAIGALGLGIIGYFVPRVLGVGYDTISDILNTKMLLGALLAVMVFKSAGAGDLAGLGHLGRPAGADVHGQRGHGFGVSP